MKNLYCFFVVVSLVIGIYLAKTIYFNSQTFEVEGKTQNGYLAGNGPGSYFYWTAQPWDAPNAPYLAIQQKIDAQVKAGENPRALARSYRQYSLSRPLDAESQFGWAYAAYSAYQARWKTGKDESDILRGVREAMEKPKATNSYEYARLRMLITHLDVEWYSDIHVRQCAKRLLTINPNDTEVKIAFAGEFSFTSNSDQTQELGYKWGREYLAKYPNRPQAHYIMGFVLGNRMSRTRSQKMGYDAIDQLRECQKTLSADHSYFQKAQSQIVEVKRRLTRYRAKGSSNKSRPNLRISKPSPL